MREHTQNACKEEGRESRAATLQQMRTHARPINASGNGFQCTNETCPVYGDNCTKKKASFLCLNNKQRLDPLNVLHCLVIISLITIIIQGVVAHL